jgi:hypothetical protein
LNLSNRLTDLEKRITPPTCACNDPKAPVRLQPIPEDGDAPALSPCPICGRPALVMGRIDFDGDRPGTGALL